MNNVRVVYAFKLKDLSNGFLRAQFGVFSHFQPRLKTFTTPT